MSSSRYEKFFDTVFNEEINNFQKGFTVENLKERISFSDDIIYEIPLIYNFRPDRIAKQFYGNSRLYWVLVYANNIENSPEGFFSGRKIRVPKPEKILEVI
jgi:hypothetical protein